MAVVQAREQGQIKKRNILKMDLKINTQILKYIDDTNPKLKATMPEQVKDFSSNQKQLRDLPSPVSSIPKKKVEGFQISVNSDLNHWQSLPNDVKSDEIERVHKFLFPDIQEQAAESLSFLPTKLTTTEDPLEGL